MKTFLESVPNRRIIEFPITVSSELELLWLPRVNPYISFQKETL